MDGSAPTLTSEFADKFPGLSLAWQASGINEAELVWLNAGLAQELLLKPDWLRSDAGVKWLTGQTPAPGSKPVAQVYAGHQFGFYSPRLGDGRALLLGELRDTHGTLRDIHLKGSGPTPFSRGGDGFAPLGAMLREAVMGESMHALKIKTSRILAVIKTGRWLARDGEPHPAAIAVRVAEGHLRVGTFEFVRRTGDIEELQRLTEYALRRHYPEKFYKLVNAGASADDGVSSKEIVSRELLTAVIDAQANLVASWMLVGFVHGVINTDNVTISGETIDYGPCAMMDFFNPSVVFSSIDSGGRYAYRNQPGVMQWNMARFAETLLPLLADAQQEAVAIAEEEVQNFHTLYESYYERGLRLKLGLESDTSEQSVTEEAATEQSLAAHPQMEKLRTEKPDYTKFFRAISDSNPVYIARNHIVAEALDEAEAGNLEKFETLIQLVSSPYDRRAGFEAYEEPAGRDSGVFITTCGT